MADKHLDSGLRITDKTLLWQWEKVLRLKAAQQIILFNQDQTEAVYKILKISNKSVDLEKLSDIKPKKITKKLFLFWSLLKRDNNELILQKCTELGVSDFVPVISDRTIKKDFNLERSQKIVIEASEQCGRFDIPQIHSPLKLKATIEKHKDKVQLMVCEPDGLKIENCKLKISEPSGVLIGPEGGWSNAELALFKNRELAIVKISELTLRAETAAIVAVSKLL
ncbi:16S rRNA (uracil(1498)-N(3))-methyltransferase [Candidatus Parcubacteria bacterium]|nr:16S rRNA (uracil(1498)-N(3))-methyltransferase [Candidatus Parcubacteria bacterium]